MTKLYVMIEWYIMIGIYVLSIAACIIKKVRHSKSVGFNLLWLILYNEALVFLSAYVILTPRAEHVPGTRIGYMPAEFIVLTTVPLIFIGFIMKLIFLCTKGKKGTEFVENNGTKYWRYWCKGSSANFIYIICSFFWSAFFFGILIAKFFWLPGVLLWGGVLAIVMPLLPRIYELVKHYRQHKLKES